MSKLPGETVDEAGASGKLLALGSGAMLEALVTACFTAGLPEIHMLSADPRLDDDRTLTSLAAKAADAGIKAEVMNWEQTGSSTDGWRERLRPYRWILYAKREAAVEEVHALVEACRADNKTLLAAICLGTAGFAGPMEAPGVAGGWESAWRRLRCSTFGGRTAASLSDRMGDQLLVNIIVHDLFKAMTRSAEPELIGKFYLLNMRTLEGGYHAFAAHPLVSAGAGVSAVQVQSWRMGKMQARKRSSDPLAFLAFVDRLTSPYAGILHVWDEGGLPQLPLAQCLVQASDPLAEQPSEPLPAIVCAGMTHLEARKEAGLAGIEAYAARLLTAARFDWSRGPGGQPMCFPACPVGIGAGETAEEAVHRGLLDCLAQHLRRRSAADSISRVVRIGELRDRRCRYYLHALTTLQGEPVIGLGEPLYGFPVFWVTACGRRFGSVGLDETSALEGGLRQALLSAQNAQAHLAPQRLELTAAGGGMMASADGDAVTLTLGETDRLTLAERLREAESSLARQRIRLIVLKLSAEPELSENLGGLFGVMLDSEVASI